ncbi:MAG: diaminopimelate epimerase [Lachnospiraceae bacterium]|nr:diaminopimelate epimerase [Lachnospiraceae bacterium]
MHFTKMQGCGNDYVYVYEDKEQIPAEKKPELARKISDRHFGVGSDGLIFIRRGKIADFEMEMYNADGSRSEMCGNGIRCVGKYVHDKGYTQAKDLRIESCGKVKYLHLNEENGQIKSLRVNMGTPILEAAQIPVVCEKDKAIDETILVDGTAYQMTCVSMGNPHAVVFVPEDFDLWGFDIRKVGPFFERHERFPNRVNTEFVKVIDDTHVEMRVWERGAGETFACGTGCCAVGVACVLNHRTSDHVDVKLLGGHLEIEWDRKEDVVYMTGPAEFVFEGEWMDV